MTPREVLLEALTLERFTLHIRADQAPNPNTPLPVDTVENGAEGVDGDG